MTNKTYAVVRYRVPPRLVKRASAALLAVRFMGWAVSSRTAGGADLDLYAAGSAPRAAMAAPARLGPRPVARRRARGGPPPKKRLPHEARGLMEGGWGD